MVLGILLALQVAIIPMTMDSTRVVGDSVEFLVKWGYDTAPGVPMLKIDTLRAHYGKTPSYSKTKKITPVSTRSWTIRYPKRQGDETAFRWFCVRYYSKLKPTIRCVNNQIKYLVRVIMKPDSVAFHRDSAGNWTHEAFPPD